MGHWRLRTILPPLQVPDLLNLPTSSGMSAFSVTLQRAAKWKNFEKRVGVTESGVILHNTVSLEEGRNPSSSLPRPGG